MANVSLHACIFVPFPSCVVNRLWCARVLQEDPHGRGDPLPDEPRMRRPRRATILWSKRRREDRRKRSHEMKRTVGYVIGLAVLLCTGVAGNARAQVACTNTPLPE